MVVIWGSASRSSIQIIERSIRRSARVILLKCKYDSILADIYSYLNWFMPTDNYKYFSLCNLFNIQRYNNFQYFDSVIVLNSDRACHSTRSTNKIYVPNVRRNRYAMRSFFYSASSLWNELPEELKSCQSMHVLKKRQSHILTCAKANTN
jgi:hypothetical protein